MNENVSESSTASRQGEPSPAPDEALTRSRLPPGGRPSRRLLIFLVLFQYLLWSNSFIAISYLLGQENVAGQLDWMSLALARYLASAALCLVYCVGFRLSESIRIVRDFPGRLLACGLLAVPAYNFGLYYGQQHGVAAPIASLISALVPLFVLLLSAMFLKEKVTPRRLLGVGVAFLGMAVIASPLGAGLDLNRPLHMAIVATAPLSWALVTILSKPVASRVSPVLWAYLALIAGAILVAVAAPGGAWIRVARLNGPGWLAIAFLTVLCTVLGFAVWVWLLKHLPATVVGFTVFLNPPLTALSKLGLNSALPDTFSFSLGPTDWLGGTIALLGLAIAVYGRPPRAGSLVSMTDR